MRKYKEVIVVTIIVLVLALSLGSWSVGQGSIDSEINIQTEDPMLGIFSEIQGAADGKLEAMADGTNASVFFYPQDTSNTATVLFVTNLGNTTAMGWIFRYTRSGDLLSTFGEFILAPGEMMRICTDEVTTSVSGWDSAWHLNFGNMTAYTEMVVPLSFIVDGYVVWNGADNKYDPDVPAHTHPLRFEWFLPAQ